MRAFCRNVIINGQISHEAARMAVTVYAMPEGMPEFALLPKK